MTDTEPTTKDKQAGMSTQRPKRYGYIRTSTERQNPARQIDGLKAQCDEVHLEHGISACAGVRPIYDMLITILQPGDTLVVWDVDRAYRSVIDALTEVGSLNARGIGFEAMGRDYDLTSPEDGFILTLEAAFGEYERQKLRKRTKEGLAAAKARGVKLGRPRKLSEFQIRRAHELLAQGTHTIKQIAKTYGVAARTLLRALQ